MFRLFRKKEIEYFDLNSYDYEAAGYRKMTEEELYRVNGGGWEEQAYKAAHEDAGDADKTWMPEIHEETQNPQKTATGGGNGNDLNNNTPAEEEYVPEYPKEEINIPNLDDRKKALTDKEQNEMAKAGRNDSKVKTVVWIVRNDDGLGNRFNATRYIMKNGKIVYQDVVGANAYAEDLSNGDFTTPDGSYYLSNTKTNKTPLYKQKDGTVNSESFKNVLSLRTIDPKISEDMRNAINQGDRLFHANQKVSNKNGPYSVTNPYGLGCIIGQGGQAHQDNMMNYLMDGVNNPENIEVRIVSLSNLPGFKK